MNKSRLATEQLVVADAVDHAVSQIDFTPISGRKVYLDKQYMPPTNAPGKPPVNSSNVEYVIGSLRQQMVAYNCQLQDKPETADIIVEARLGALGSDGNEATYGLPTGAVVRTAAATMTPGGDSLPQLPDLALGRRNHQLGAARIGVFAYDQKTREPVWQAGVATGNSQARDLWVLGIGPFQHGRIYDQVKTATKEPKLVKQHDDLPQGMASYLQPQTFQRALAPGEQSPARILNPAPATAEASPAQSMAGNRP
ncbi:DUF6655 family protein [Anatilimnocola sp. NA78]|uniref:DUF6655 family protein n=1 Tax=Anatilimnocola sp. NA78 TaxID=3415683 RepID=UPI003CE4C937